MILMKHIARRVADISVDNIVTLSQLKSINYPLYKYVMNNFDKVQEDINSLGVFIFLESDKQTVKRDILIKLIRYYYGDKVDMDQFIKDKFALHTITLKTKTERTLMEFLVNAGFKVDGERIRRIDTRFCEKLKAFADENGFIKTVDYSKNQSFYNRLRARARYKGISIKEFVESLGFTYGYDNLIKQMKHEGYSYTQIAAKVGVSWIAVYNKCRKWREQGEVFKDARRKAHRKL